MNESIITAERESQRRREELGILRNAATEKDFEILCNVPYDGDCLFSSVFKLLPFSAWSSAQLPKDLVTFFTNVQVNIIYILD